MIVGRILGWLFIAAALLAASAEVATTLHEGSWQTLQLGPFSAGLHAPSLDGFRRLVAASPTPGLWDSGIAPALRLPAWPTLLAVGAALLYLFRRRLAQAVPRPGAQPR